jgi:hypothetical protein
MALDTNIALGIRPVEQPNMLAQMGQMMALRGAQQEYEGTNALRDAYAQGGDLNDPAFRRRVMSANPKLGSQLISQHSETSARDIKTQADSLKTIKDNIGLANNPQAMAEYLKGAYSTPGGALLAKLVPLDKALASIPNDPKAFADFQRNFGLTTDKLFVSAADLLQAQVTREGHGVTMYGHNLTKEKNDYERRYPVMNQVITSQGVGVTPSRGPNAGVITPVNEPGATPPPAATTIFSSVGGGPLGSGTYGVPNALAQGAPSNMLRADAQAPAAAGAAPVRAQPKPVVRQPVAVMRNGKAVMVPPDEAVGLPPASPDAEKAARLEALKVLDLGRTIRNLEAVTREGGLISQSTGSGVGRAYDVGAAFVGQATEGAIANAKLAPIADMVLKMVPRFEGPQSDKDTQSYKEAAGQLANSSLPTKIRQEAGKEILRLMKEYKDQFVSSAMDAEGISPANTPARSGDIADNAEIKAAMDWANSNPKDPRSAKIKQHFGAK